MIHDYDFQPPPEIPLWKLWVGGTLAVLAWAYVSNQDFEEARRQECAAKPAGWTWDESSQICHPPLPAATTKGERQPRKVRP